MSQCDISRVFFVSRFDYGCQHLSPSKSLDAFLVLPCRRSIEVISCRSFYALFVWYTFDYWIPNEIASDLSDTAGYVWCQVITSYSFVTVPPLKYTCQYVVVGRLTVVRMSNFNRL